MSDFGQTSRELYRLWLLGLATQHGGGDDDGAADAFDADILLRQVDIDNVLEVIERTKHDKRLTLKHWGTILLGLARAMLNRTRAFQPGRNLPEVEDVARAQVSMEVAREGTVSPFLAFPPNDDVVFMESTGDQDVVNVVSPKNNNKSMRLRKSTKRLKIDHQHTLPPMAKLPPTIDWNKVIPNWAPGKNYADDNVVTMLKRPTGKLPTSLKYLYQRGWQCCGGRGSLTCEHSIGDDALLDITTTQPLDVDSGCDNIGHSHQQQQLLPPESDKTTTTTTTTREATVATTPYVCLLDAQHTQPIWCRYHKESRANKSSLNDSLNESITSIGDTSLASIKITTSPAAAAAIRSDNVNNNNNNKNNNSSSKATKVIDNNNNNNIDDHDVGGVALRKRVQGVCTRWPYHGDCVPLEHFVQTSLPEGEALSKLSLVTHFAALLELASDNIVGLAPHQSVLAVLVRRVPAN